MGWLSPIVIVAKILLQYLWLLKLDWDDSLPDNLCQHWRNWCSQHGHLNAIQLPRWSFYSPQAQLIEIHGVSDASKDTYAAVACLRVVQDSQLHVSFQLAKTRVAHLKTLSIPRQILHQSTAVFLQ